MRDEQEADCLTGVPLPQTAKSRATEQNIFKGIKTPAECLNSHGYKTLTRGIDNHLDMINLRNRIVDSSSVERY